MDFFRVRRERIHAPRHTVVKPGPDTDHNIAIMHRIVGLIRAMHAQHTQPLLVLSRERTQPHQR